MLIHNADITGSFLYNGINISNVTGSSTSLNALNQFSASINLFTGSYNTGSFTGSFIGNGSGLNGVVSASFASAATSASQANNANTATSASQAANAVTSSYAANADLLDGKNSTEFAITGSNTFVGTQYVSATNNATSFTSTASIYTDGGFRVTKDAYVSGTIYVNNLTVYGTQSINYITSSQLNIGTNIITVNTDVPAIRFGGLAVYDSGSTRLTGSMLWDSEDNHWIYSNPSGSSYDGGMMISGPRNSSGLGNEQGTLNNVVMKGQGGDHITSSMITETGTATTFYTNALYVTSSNFVGIGTTSPTALLHLASNLPYIYLDDNSSSGTLKRFQIISGDVGTTQTVNFGFNNTSGTALIDVLAISEAGRVGIGTNSPFTQLHINGTPDTNYGNQTLFDNRSATINYGGVLSFAGYKTSTSAANVWAQIAGRNEAGTGTENGYLSFITNTGSTYAERMRISSGGNVGIGTNSPNYSLHINRTDGSFFIGSSTRYGYFVPQSGTQNISYLSMRYDDNGVADSIRLYNSYEGAGFGQGVAMYGAGDKVMGSLQIIQTDTNNTEAKFVLNLRNADASSAKVTVLGNGNVGIGTINPASNRKLTVVGGAQFTGGDNSGASFNIVPGTNGQDGADFNLSYYTGTGYGPLTFTVGGSERMRITSGGNVNINTTNAYTSRLSVQAAAANRPAIKAGFGASAGNGYWILGDNYTLDESLMSIGIDYSSGGLVLGSALAPSTTTQGAFISTQAQFGGFGSAIRLSTSGEIYFYNGTQNSVISTGSAKSASIAMTILQTGRVGIGTTNPTAQLQISSASGGLISINSTTTNSFRGITFQNNAASDSTEYAYIKYNATSGEMRYYANPAAFGGFTTFYSNNTESMRITSDGKLLVGITSASGRITLAYDQSVNNQFINIVGTQTSYNQEWGFGIPTNSKDLRTYDYTTGLERMRITNGGVVLIGQSTSSLTDNGWQLSGVGGGHTAFQVTNNEAFIFNNRTGGTTYQIDFRTLQVERGAINVTDSGVAYTTASDYRLKEDLQSIQGLDKLSRINVYNFKWKINGERIDGVLAHELQEVLPYAVSGEKDGKKYQGVDYGKIVPILIQSIKELKAEIDLLKNK